MALSKKRLLRERVEALVRADDRWVDMAAQLRVMRCSCGVAHIDWPADKLHQGEPQPAELLPTVYGGRYDRLNRCYVGPAERLVEIQCHEGQVPVLTFEDDSVMRVLALGSPGAGKTFAAVRKALLLALARPNSIGGLVAPTGDRREIVWRDFLEACPPDWIEHVAQSKKEIRLKNGTVIQVLAAKRSAAQYGSPLSGRSWDWCVVDESSFVDDDAHQEIATRGRRAGRAYKIYETATNAQVAAFRMRLEQFKTNPLYRRINFSGWTNPWVDPGYWQRMRADMSERDFREKILAEDVPPELLVYSRFSFEKTICPRGVAPAWLSDIERRKWGRLRDVTEQITSEAFGQPFKQIIAQDFGVLVNAAVVLKAYQTAHGERIWWAIDEITSGGATDLHARKLAQYYDQTESIVIADPHFNTKQGTDKSDYNIFSSEGWIIKPATAGQISRKHRISMLQALLEDADGNRRFFIDQAGAGKPRCKRLVQSFMVSAYNDAGEPEREKKTGISDPSHWPSAVGFGLYRWERMRGANQEVRTFAQIQKERAKRLGAPDWTNNF